MEAAAADPAAGSAPIGAPRSLTPGDIVLAERPLLSVLPVPEDSPILQLELDSSISIHAIAAAVQYFYADPEVQLKAAALQRFPQDAIAAQPLTTAVNEACEALKALNLLPSTAEPSEFAAAFYLFTLHSCTDNGNLCLFNTGSKIKHCCRPNVKHSGNGELRALRRIDAGEELTVSYLDDDMLMLPTAMRKQKLQTTWLFQCECELCTAAVDVTRGHRCARSKCKGPVWPPTAHDAASGWYCSACGALNEQLNPEAETALFESLECLQSVTHTTVAELLQQVSYKQLRDMLKSEFALVLHSTHWLVSLLHMMCGLLCLKGEQKKPRAAVVHFKVRSDALKKMLGETVMDAQATIWQYRGDAAQAKTGGLDEALYCYEASWKLSILLWGRRNERTKTIRVHVKRLHKLVTEAKEAEEANDIVIENKKSAPEAAGAEGSEGLDVTENKIAPVLEVSTAAPTIGSPPAIGSPADSEHENEMNITELTNPMNTTMYGQRAPSTASSYCSFEIEDGERSPGGTLQFSTHSLLDSDDDALLLDDSDQSSD